MNLILAAVVDEYDKSILERRENSKKAAQTCLRKAYKLLDPQGCGRIDRETVMALFFILNDDFPEFRKLSKEDTSLLFAILDKDGTSTISEEEFMNFSNVLLLEFDRESDYSTWVQRSFPKLFHARSYQRFCDIVRSKRFEWGVDILLLLNAAVIAIQSYPELSGESVTVGTFFACGSCDLLFPHLKLFDCHRYLIRSNVL